MQRDFLEPVLAAVRVGELRTGAVRLGPGPDTGQVKVLALVRVGQHV
ncbi:hypothetical protein [Streptomyces mirabilis]